MKNEDLGDIKISIFWATLCVVLLMIVAAAFTWATLGVINTETKNITAKINTIAEPKVVYVVAETRGNAHPASFEAANKQIIAEIKKAGYTNVTVMPQPFENDDLVMISFEQPSPAK